MRLKVLLATVSLAVLATPASSALITRNFDIFGTDFELQFGDPSVAPVSTLALNITLTFDPAASSGASTSGLTVNSFNLPYPVSWAKSVNTLVLATHPTSGGCFNPPNTFCIFISNAGGTNPNPFFIQQSTSSGGFWLAQTRRVQINEVPEPATWAMLIAGFGLAGTAMRRRTRSVSFA